MTFASSREDFELRACQWCWSQWSGNGEGWDMGAQAGPEAQRAVHLTRSRYVSQASSWISSHALKDLDPVYVSQDDPVCETVSRAQTRLLPEEHREIANSQASELNCLRASLAQERAARVAMEELVTKLDLEVQELRQQLFAERAEMEAILLASDVEKEVIASNWQVIADRHWQLEAK
ncbi:unnamed protein product, partial [Symbiodinium sp. KB8]